AWSGEHGGERAGATVGGRSGHHGGCIGARAAWAVAPMNVSLASQPERIVALLREEVPQR
ncbi:MAG: hypothetical protein ACRDJN_06510, partial [Chloroflexota bacterium]